MFIPMEEPYGSARELSGQITETRQQGQPGLNPVKYIPLRSIFGPQAMFFKKGHQIRVEISSSNFPRFDRNLNTGNNFATDTTMITASQVVYHSREYPSCIILPVIKNP